MTFTQELESIQLLEPQMDGGRPLMQVLKYRSSSREFSNEKLPMQVLSNMLWAAFGVNRPESGKRTAPSANNRQEIDIYIATSDGLYMYDAKVHMLMPVLTEDIRVKTGTQSYVQEAPVNLIYVSDFSKMGNAEESQKYITSSANTGFISQNVYLCCVFEIESMEEKNMQVLVMYYSKTGNTKKLAEEIVKGVQEVKNVKCVLKPVSEITKDDFLLSNGIIAGSPVYFGTMAAELKDVFDKFVGIRNQMGDKIGAAFATSGDPSGGKETTIISIIQAMLIYGMIITGDPLDATGHYGVSCTGTPDKHTARNAAKLGKRVALLAKKLI